MVIIIKDKNVLHKLMKIINNKIKKNNIIKFNKIILCVA